VAKIYDVEIEIVEQRGRCPNGHRVGEKFRAGRKTPGGICMGAFASLLPFITALKFGGSFPWEEREGEGTFCCPDHRNITVYRLRRVERES
jgi:uncharacterized repeat protein (TIGR04076 family)